MTKTVNRIVVIPSEDVPVLPVETELDSLTTKGYAIVAVVPASHTRSAYVLLSQNADETSDVPADPNPPPVA